MNEENKLYVLNKKEVFFLLTLVLVCLSIFFVLGVKVGKNYSFSISGIMKTDKEQLDFLSTEEEVAKKVLKENGPVVQKTKPEDNIKLKTLDEQNYELLKKKIDMEISPEEPVVKQQAEVEGAPTSVSETPREETVNGVDPVEDLYVGKWTIQLGSYDDKGEAQSYANGLQVRGYSPILNEVNLGERGRWYRVSLGAFDNLVDAKNYVVREKSLFSGQDYVFVQFE